MTIRLLYAGRLFRFLCIFLAVMMAAAPSASVMAQTNAAQQAVRQRVEQYGPYSAGPADSRETAAPSEYGTTYVDPSVPKIDVNFISPAASAVVVIRPSQLLTSPNSEMLPKEVVAAAGIKFLGFDPAEVEEIVGFVEMANPLAFSYGLAVKFNNPFRATSIPIERRAHAQLAELAGKKYLQSSVPGSYSLYGPNNKTLVIAPDPTLRQLVDTIGQRKTGPLVERVQNAPAGSDLYIAIDVASLRPIIQMYMAPYQAQVSADMKPLLEAPNLITAAELTLNLSNEGPISLIFHANDEAAAQQLEAMLLEFKTKSQAASQAAAADDPIQLAMIQYTDRVSRPFTPQRNGASITYFSIDDQYPAQKQLITSMITGAAAVAFPAMQNFRAVQQAQAMQSPGAPDALQQPPSSESDAPQPPLTEREAAPESF